MSETVFALPELTILILSNLDPICILSISKVNKTIRNTCLKGFTMYERDLLLTCVNKGYPELYKYFNVNNVFSQKHLRLALQNGNLDFIKGMNYIHHIDRGDFHLVIEHGHLELMKYIRKHLKPRIDSYTIECAVKSGNIEIMKHLMVGSDVYENLRKRGAYYCRYAVRNSKLEMLIWLRESIGCEWDETSFLEAMILCSIEILNYLHVNGCHTGDRIPYTSSTEVRQWCIDKGYKIEGISRTRSD